ncbi:MAG: hypothetical protein RJQ09_04470 [Cyclobacteriaceae bacterium]
MKKHLFWLIYLIFVVAAIALNGDESPFVSYGPYSFGKYLAWAAFLAFTAFSYHCSLHENLFKTMKTMSGMYWGRQIGIDLYIGLTLFILLIYAHQQSGLVVLLWLIPLISFVNLATLLYIALHYDSLVAFLI